MKIALNGATTMHADLETDIKAASEAGFELIEIWAAKLRVFLKTKTTADLKDLLTQNNIEPYSINSIEHITFRTAEDYAHIKAETEELTSIAGEIGCPYVVVVPGKLPENASKDEIIEESVKVLNELGDIAEKHNVGLAFEFLGQTDCSVQTLDLCNEIVEKVFVIIHSDDLVIRIPTKWIRQIPFPHGEARVLRDQNRRGQQMIFSFASMTLQPDRKPRTAINFFWRAHFSD